MGKEGKFGSTNSLARKLQARKESDGAATSAKVIEEQLSAEVQDSSVIMAPLDQIDVEEQLRDKFDPEHIRNLAHDFAASERKQPDNPITLWRRKNGRYLVDTGENVNAVKSTYFPFP